MGKSPERARAACHLGSTAGGTWLREGDKMGKENCAYKQPPKCAL